MAAIEFNGTQIELNEEGFLVDPGVWNEELALLLAQKEENLAELSEDHWAVIRFHPPAFPGASGGAHGALHLQDHRSSSQAHLRSLPQRTCQGSLQAGGPAQA